MKEGEAGIYILTLNWMFVVLFGFYRKQLGNLNTIDENGETRIVRLVTNRERNTF